MIRDNLWLLLLRYSGDSMKKYQAYLLNFGEGLNGVIRKI